MSITITVAHTVPDDAFARIVALTNLLKETDTNFVGLPIAVARGSATDVAVSDSEDAMREKLLWLLVEDALKSAPSSVMGSLC